MTVLTPIEARRVARLAGFFYLVIFVLAIYANMFAIGGLVVKGDPASTMANVIENLGTFRLGAAAFIIVLIADVVISWALYEVLKPAGARLSLLTAMFRLIYTAMFAAVALSFVEILEILEAGPALSQTDAQAGVYMALRSYTAGFAVSLIFFAVHLVLLGVLLIRARYLPTLIGVLIILAGAGYAIDGFGTLLFETYGSLANVITMIVIVPALIGEGGLCLWLLLRGLNVKKWPEGDSR